MACDKYCYDKTVSADKVMSCALDHKPPNLHVARDVAQKPLGINGTNSAGWNLLHFAAFIGDMETGGLAMARGLDPMAGLTPRLGQEYHGVAHTITPLVLAVTAESLCVLRLLLKVPKVRDSIGNDIRPGNTGFFRYYFRTAAREGRMVIMPLLVEAVASVHDSGKDCFPELFRIALDERSMEMLRLLVGCLGSGWKLGDEGVNGCWLLLFALSKRYAEMVNFLVDSFGLEAFRSPGVASSRAYRSILCATVFDCRNNVAILEKLKALRPTLVDSDEENCQQLAKIPQEVGILLSVGASAVRKVTPLYAEFGIEIEEPAAGNVAFLEEWIAEDASTDVHDITPSSTPTSTPTKRRRMGRHQTDGSE